MAKSEPLKGIELIDCARANAKEGVATAAQLSGYGQDVETFQRELIAACHRIGVEIQELSQLMTHQQIMGLRERGLEVAPDSDSDL